MHPTRTFGRPILLAFLCYGWIPLAALAADRIERIPIEVAGGTVEVLQPFQGARWIRTTKGGFVSPKDRVRTGPNSRLALRWSDNSVMRFGALTEIEILPSHAPDAEPGLHLFRGILSFFHREEPGRVRVLTRGMAAGILGTEFVLAVDAVTERTTMWLIDGKVGLTNEFGSLTITDGEAAIVELGQPPRPTAGFIARNILQWCFYYPGVLDLRELPLSADEQRELDASLTAYRAGDLLAALANYPGRPPGSDADKIYYAALLLSVGQVEQSESVLIDLRTASVAPIQRLAGALRHLIAAVKHEVMTPAGTPELASELLAASYYEQSRALGDESLKRALQLARAATTNSPEFGFAWARVAELEFSFGHTSKALDALEKSLALSPRNAQALALKGFLLAAQNKPREAITWFDHAIDVDSALGNAWLGRGLCRIRRGDLRGGREDLLLAAALEPRRAALRSYLGKTYAESNDPKRALHELDLAKEIDPNDPTALLYSALVKAEHSRINEGIRDLEKSQELNDNRRLYRSRFLLDRDKAIGSVNLARLYADSDLQDVAVHEAGRAIVTDYADYSAHVFLANSYEVERRANLSNLRFEAASFGEYLLANLLGPANGRLLAQPVTQLDYSTLFERNRVGVIANTEYFDRGAWHQSSAQYGTFNGSSYSLESEYRTEPGERKNQDLEIRQLEGKFKYDLTPEDSLYFHVGDFRSHGGDTAQHFDESEVETKFRFREEQTPTVLAGYHHQWSPQNHTLLLAGRFDDTLETANPYSQVYALDRLGGARIGLAQVPVQHNYQSRAQVYAVEAQQIAVLASHSLIAGARAEWSEQSIADRVENAKGANRIIMGTNEPISLQRENLSSYTAAIYGYDYVRLGDALQVVGGLNFTHQSVPVNTATPPMSSQRDHQERLSPKAAIIWSLSPSQNFRASYTRSLTGSGLGQSVRLEPTHVAGLLQTFRAPVPSSLAGELDGADLETSELLWEGKFDRTYLSLGGQRLVAERNRKLGLYLSDTNTFPSYDLSPTWGLIRERVQFREHALEVSAHHLISDEWSFGVQYRLGYAELKRSFPDYPNLGVGGLTNRSCWQGWLHTLNLSGLYRHHSGVFARAEGVFIAQDRERKAALLSPDVPWQAWQIRRDKRGDDFWQVNLVVGYRFPKQRAEIAMGVLNLLDRDYHLDPINAHADRARARTLYARLLLNF